MNIALHKKSIDQYKINTLDAFDEDLETSFNSVEFSIYFAVKNTSEYAKLCKEPIDMIRKLQKQENVKIVKKI